MKKLCPIHGVYNTSKCVKCNSLNNRVYDKTYRDKESSKFYHSRNWKQVRDIQLKSSPLCVECGMPAKIVDHIVEIRDGGEKLSLENLQSMCISCHNIKTAAERGKRGGAVKSLQTEQGNTEPPHKLLDKPFLGGTL